MHNCIYWRYPKQKAYLITIFKNSVQHKAYGCENLQPDLWSHVVLLVSVSSIESHRLSKSASLRSARVRTVHFTMEENPLFCLLSHYSNLKRPEATWSSYTLSSRPQTSIFVLWRRPRWWDIMRSEEKKRPCTCQKYVLPLNLKHDSGRLEEILLFLRQ